MKRDFTHENFEDFLKRSADSLRMKAPDRVWQNLSKGLHQRKRRIIFGLSAFLLIASGAGYYITSQVSEQVNTSTNQPVQQQVTKTNSALKKTDIQEKYSQHPPSNELTQSNIRTQSNVSSFVGHSTIANEKLDEQVITSANPQSEENSSNQNSFSATVVDSYTEFDEPHTAAKSELKQNELNSVAALPLTIESVINQYKAQNKKRKLETQLYFTPTISYRKLTENKSYLRTLNPANLPTNLPPLHSNVNNNVTHKPDVGFELGLAVKYPISNKLKLRSGIQFNVNRYDVKAFNAPLSNAIIALNAGSRIDSFNTTSGYSNVQRLGYKSSWLQNLSFQLSAPIGAEYIISDNDKVQFGVAATVQPTYVLGDRAYLITTDYKSYAQAPSLIRRWNVNTAFETFVTLNSGKTKWQVGPQVRYQLLSSFISKYPVKENLFDFGLKVGVSLK